MDRHTQTVPPLSIPREPKTQNVSVWTNSLLPSISTLNPFPIHLGILSFPGDGSVAELVEGVVDKGKDVEF